jgi:ABC-type transporter lipoprotein component MlaA
MDDPFESVNRAVFRLDLLADGWALEPAARAYGAVTPEPVRQSIANFLRNLRAPVVLTNDILQGEGVRAGTTLRRFAINSALTAAFGATAVSEREANLEALQALSAGSLDLYATVRSVDGQHRAAEIRNGRKAAVAQEEGYGDIFRDFE